MHHHRGLRDELVIDVGALVVLSTTRTDRHSLRLDLASVEPDLLSVPRTP